MHDCFHQHNKLQLIQTAIRDYILSYWLIEIVAVDLFYLVIIRFD